MVGVAAEAFDFEPAFAPNEIAFFDGEHPTSAAQGVLSVHSTLE